LKIEIYGTKTCNMCKMLCKKLDEKEISYKYEQNFEVVQLIAKKYNASSVPIIVVNDVLYNMKTFSEQFLV
jgi:glutaredoxin